MSQRDFLMYVANDAFLRQVDVFRDWTIRSVNTVRGSYRPEWSDYGTFVAVAFQHIAKLRDQDCRIGTSLADRGSLFFYF